MPTTWYVLKQHIYTDGHGQPLAECELERVRKFHPERYPEKLQLCEGARVMLLKNKKN